MPRYIDADALKDVVQQHDYPLADRLNSVDNGMFTLGIFQAIDEQPTVSPDEVRGKGKWIHKSHVYGVVYCSECDYELHIDNTNYCPHCGAKMKGTDDTE